MVVVAPGNDGGGGCVDVVVGGGGANVDEFCDALLAPEYRRRALFGSGK